MNIILLERVGKLGDMGEEVRVRDGYARNYLLPQGKALRATESNREYFRARREEIEARNRARRQEAETAAGKIDGVSLTMVRQAGETGQLYGSVTARDIADAVREHGTPVERGQVLLGRQIKLVGLHHVDIRLHAEVTATVIVNVARSEAEAEQQLGAGRTVSVEEQQRIADSAVEEVRAEAEALEQDTAGGEQPAQG